VLRTTGEGIWTNQVTLENNLQVRFIVGSSCEVAASNSFGRIDLLWIADGSKLRGDAFHFISSKSWLTPHWKNIRPCDLGAFTLDPLLHCNETDVQFR
jgi:hypothetical protein